MNTAELNAPPRESLMKRLATFAVSGYSAAVLCVVGFAWSTLFIPIGAIFSAAALGLILLHLGRYRCLSVAAGALPILAAILALTSASGMMDMNVGSEMALILAHWIPVVVLAQVLRATQSLSYTLQGLVSFMVVVILFSFIAVPDSAAKWDQLFHWLSQGELQKMMQSAPAINENYLNALDIMTGIIAASMSLIWLAALLLARWQQALIANPGGFVQEFTQMQLGKVIAAGGLLCLLATPFSPSPVLVELILVLMMIFFFQGVATVHFLLKKVENGKTFLFIFYGALAFSVWMPILPTLMSVLGMLENFIGLRQRIVAEH